VKSFIFKINCEQKYKRWAIDWADGEEDTGVKIQKTRKWRILMKAAQIVGTFRLRPQLDSKMIVW